MYKPELYIEKNITKKCKQRNREFCNNRRALRGWPDWYWCCYKYLEQEVSAS